jgi:hypothetical protein
MSEMPPESIAQGDVEMLEFLDGNGNGGEQAQNPDDHPYAYDLDMSRPPARTKEGNWNDSELIADRKIQW